MAWRWHPLTEGSRGYNFRAGTHKWAGSELGRILRVVVGLVLVIAAYVTVIALYHSTGLADLMKSPTVGRRPTGPR